MTTYGLKVNVSAGLAIAKRSKKLAQDIEKLVNPEAAPFVLVEEGIALLDADGPHLRQKETFEV